MSRRIGITGNIGAGKSTVCAMFARLGVPVYYADARGKALMTEDADLRQAIAERFGSDSYTAAGTLNRAHLSRLVFKDAEALAALDALVHPAVARDAEAWHRRQSAPYSLHEAAIIYEIGAADTYASVIVVSCPLPTRCQRVMLRDGLSAEEFAARAARQWSDERKEAAADHLIVNDGRRLLLPQVLKLHRSLVHRSHQSDGPTVY